MKKPWSMLAVNIDDVEFIPYPVIIQPKLNGIRAKWDGRELTSRQNEVWHRDALPALHDKLTQWSRCNPGITLDGELYAHGQPFQRIEAVCAVKRKAPHAAHELISLHAFDIISDAPVQKRLEQLIQIYSPVVAFTLARDWSEVTKHFNAFLEHGFEGAMLRVLGNPYLVGRTEALIRIKPWLYAVVEIIGIQEGLGKFQGCLGAFRVRGTFDGRVTTFNVGGGSITEDQRAAIFKANNFWLHRKITIRYRELSLAHIPLKPQIHKLVA